MKKILFSGSSHTQGIGLQLELSKRFNDLDWLRTHNVILPHTWTQEDFENIRKFRWPKLVSNRLGYTEIVCNDTHKDWMYNSTDVLYKLLELNPTDVSDIAHIFIEPQMLRFISKDKVQYTPTEMIHLLGDPKTDETLREQIHGFIETFDEIETAKNYIDLFCSARDRHPHIHFHLVLWKSLIPQPPDEYINKIKDNLVSIEINGVKSSNIDYLLEKNKLRIENSAFCYTQNTGEWSYGGYKDLHASKEGHSIIAQNIINRIIKIDERSK
jgi:hypothetical protein